MENNLEYAELIRLNQNAHKVRAWLLMMLSKLEQNSIINAELTEQSNKTTIDILWG